MNNAIRWHNHKETPPQQKAVSLTPDILRILEETREWAMEELNNVWAYPSLAEKYIPPVTHRVVRAIWKWAQVFEWDRKNLALLERMRLVAEDELELIDWTIVKLWYPDLWDVDEIEIFATINNMGTMNQSQIWKSYLSTYWKKFKAYRAKMSRKWFKIAWDTKDYSWLRALDEMSRIFSMFPWKTTGNHNEVILDILWRAYSWVWEKQNVWLTRNLSRGEMECFWTLSTIHSNKNKMNAIKLIRNSIWLDIWIINKTDAISALFYKDKNQEVRIGWWEDKSTIQKRKKKKPESIISLRLRIKS